MGGKTIDLEITYRAVDRAAGEVSRPHKVALLRGVLRRGQMMKLQRYFQQYDRTFRPQDFGLMHVGDCDHEILMVEAAPVNHRKTPSETIWYFYRKALEPRPKTKGDHLADLILAWKKRNKSIESDLARDTLVLARSERIRYEQATVTLYFLLSESVL